MKPSILVVMLDFLVCSLLLFVIGTGGQRTQFATSAPPATHAEFSAAALQAQQEEWNRDYEQQTLLTKLQAETTEKEQLRTRLTETSATLAAREENLRTLTQEKTRVEQAKAQTEQALAGVETQLGRVVAERVKLQQEGAAAKERLGQLQTELAGLQTQQAQLQQERAALAQHAEQLGQTVASQQTTISALSDEVRASQARAETQLADIARGQQALGTNMAQLTELTRALPAALQQGVAGVQQSQQTMQQDLAALADALRELQAGLNPEERARLLRAVGDVARGQQDLGTQLDTLIKSGQNDKFGRSLNNLETGQDALRAQTTRLGEQIESIKSRGPGPYQAVKGARIELTAALVGRSAAETASARFKSVVFPPVVRVDGRAVIVTGQPTLGFPWLAAQVSANPQFELAELQYTVRRSGDTAAPVPLTAAACVLRDNPRVVTVVLEAPPAGLTTMELATPAAVFATEQRKLHVFKTTAVGLSFEVEVVPDLADNRYAVVKRALRGLGTWLENPAYRADAGDYVVTGDGRLVGLMVSREKLLLLTKENLLSCALSIPLTDRQQFPRTIRQIPTSP